MSEVVDIGSLEFDMSAIEKQIVDNKRKLDAYSQAVQFNNRILKEQQKQVAQVAGEMAMGVALQDELNESYALGTISAEEFTEATNLLAQDMAQLQEQCDQFVEVQREMITQNHDMGESMRELQQENRNLSTLMRGGAEEVRGNETAYASLNQELNRLKLQAKNLGAEMVQMERNGETNTEAYKALKAEWEKVSAEANKLNDSFKMIDGAVGDSQRSVGDYRNAIRDTLGELSGGFQSAFEGDILGSIEIFEGGLDKMKTGLNAVFKVIMANPLIALVAVLAYAGKALYDFNAEINESNKEIEQLTGNLPPLVNELRLMGNAIETTFGVEKLEAIEQLDMLIKTFGLSSKEAFDIYTEGLVRGGALNDEFNDSIAEYSTHFQKAGFSAQEMINILNSGIDLKVYKDKLPDSVKEATIALTEQTKATRDALVNAFGAPFSDEILKRISSGKITVSQGLEEISKKAETMNLNQQQLAQLTADVFKGAGEDAGGTLVIMNALADAQNLNNKELSETQQLTQDLKDINLEYEKTLDEAFNVGVVSDFSNGLKKFWAQSKLSLARDMKMYSQIVTGLFNTVRAGAESIGRAILRIPEGFGQVTKAMKSDLSNLGSAFTNLGSVIKNGMTGNFAEAKEAYDRMKGSISSLGSATAEVFKRGATSIRDDYGKTYNSLMADQQKSLALANAEADAHKRGADARSKVGNSNTTGDGKDAMDKAKKDAEKAMKDAESAEKKRLADLDKAQKEKEKQLAEASKRELEALQLRTDNEVESAKQSLANYIAENAKKYADDKKITQAKLDDQKFFLEEQARLTKEANAKELESKLIALEAQTRAEGVTAEQIQAIRENMSLLQSDNLAKDVEADRLASEGKKKLVEDREKQIAEIESSARAIAWQTKITNLEAEHNQEFEIKKLQIESETALELDELRKKFELKNVADAENYDYLAELAVSRKELEAELQAETDSAERSRIEGQLGQIGLIEAKHAEQTKALDKATQDAKLDAYASAFGSIKSLFGESSAVGKAAAIAETTVNTYKSATAAYAAGASLGGPMGAVMGPILAGLAVASGIKNVQKIASTKTDFYTGGYTGAGGMYEEAGTVHKGEVVFSQKDVARYGGAMAVENFRTSGNSNLLSNFTPSYAGQTGMLSNSDNASLTGSTVNNVQVTLSPDSILGMQQAVYTGSSDGIGNAETNRVTAQGAIF